LHLVGRCGVCEDHVLIHPSDSGLTAHIFDELKRLTVLIESIKGALVACPILSDPIVGILVDFLAGWLGDILRTWECFPKVRVESLATLELGSYLGGRIIISCIDAICCSPVIPLVAE